MEETLFELVNDSFGHKRYKKGRKCEYSISRDGIVRRADRDEEARKLWRAKMKEMVGLVDMPQPTWVRVDSLDAPTMWRQADELVAEALGLYRLPIDAGEMTALDTLVRSADWRYYR